LRDADRTEPRSDQELIDAANAGDDAAFSALYHRYRDWVVALAYRFTGSHEDSLDVLQETFTYLLRKFPGFTLTSAMTTFLYPAVKNLSIALRQRRARHAQNEAALEQTPAPPANVDQTNAARAELAFVLAGLPAGQREVLLMRFVDDMSLDEIGHALAIPTGTVKSRLHNALQTLRGDPRTRDYFDR
jgi:RNA polymerase sigma-70 factor (ECF subfamily)